MGGLRSEKTGIDIGVLAPCSRWRTCKMPRVALLLTKVADFIKRPPIWGMALDQIRVMKEGVRADGGKAERELAIEYTPIRDAVVEAVASYQGH